MRLLKLIDKYNKYNTKKLIIFEMEKENIKYSWHYVFFKKQIKHSGKKIN